MIKNDCVEYVLLWDLLSNVLYVFLKHPSLDDILKQNIYII